MIQLADLEVLAEDTGEIAAGKEDGAGATGSDKGRLLAKVRRVAVDPSLSLSSTEANLVFKAVDSTMSRTDLATFEPRDGLFGSFFQDFQGHEVIAGQCNPTPIAWCYD